MTIPRIIHQIYEDPKGPSEMLRFIAQSWKEHHPEWEYRFWNQSTIESFLESEYPEFIPIYRAYPYNVQRWDAIRYLILYRIGGMYVDFDYECMASLEPYLTDQTCVMGLEPQRHAERYNYPQIVGNALMASAPRHPYFKAMIDDLTIHWQTRWKNSSYQVLESTGPFMVTRVYNQFSEKHSISLLSDALVAPLAAEDVREYLQDRATEEMINRVGDAVAIHYFIGSWVAQLDK